MDSFVLSETFKYLYMIFADPSDLIFDPDNYVFTTEAHFLPLNIGNDPNEVCLLFSLNYWFGCFQRYEEYSSELVPRGCENNKAKLKRATHEKARD